jgi:hypothetical protein
METLLKKLDELEDLIKADGLPMPKIKTPNANGRPKGTSAPKASFSTPKTPGINPASKKDPVKVAQQLSNPELKDERIKQAKEALSLNSRGQWRLS